MIKYIFYSVPDVSMRAGRVPIVVEGARSMGDIFICIE